jgi:hypothetical protein
MSRLKSHFSVNKTQLPLSPVFYQHAGTALFHGLSGI